MELITENIGKITIITLLAEELDAGNGKWFKSRFLCNPEFAFNEKP